VKDYILVLEKKKRYQYGAFPRTKAGRENAKKYVKKLKKEHNMDFVLK
jgi:hypothetical protein